MMDDVAAKNDQRKYHFALKSLNIFSMSHIYETRVAAAASGWALWVTGAYLASTCPNSADIRALIFPTSGISHRGFLKTSQRVLLPLFFSFAKKIVNEKPEDVIYLLQVYQPLLRPPCIWSGTVRSQRRRAVRGLCLCVFATVSVSARGC